jgi:hypothetical protein
MIAVLYLLCATVVGPAVWAALRTGSDSYKSNILEDVVANLCAPSQTYKINEAPIGCA